MTFNICAQIVSIGLYVEILFCVKCLAKLSIFIDDDNNLVLVSKFVVVIILSRMVPILSEWWPCRPPWAHP